MRWNSRLVSCASHGVLARSSASTRSVERVAVRRSAQLGRETRDPGLQDATHLEPPDDGIEPERRDEEAAIRLELDDQLAGEPMQGLAYRRARYTECVCELSLADPGPGRELPILDHRTDAVVGQIHDGIGLDALDLASPRCPV